MSIFDHNPNAGSASSVKRHWIDSIKNEGMGNNLLWKHPMEDFNTHSVLTVDEGEVAIFFKDGIIHQIVPPGRHVLSTENHPFISKLTNAFSGGVSTFNCKVFFVRTAHSMEILWGTTTPIQVRDPKWNLSTSLRGNGAYKIQVADPRKFFTKMVGTGISTFSQESVNDYLSMQMQSKIKSHIGKAIMSKQGEEILGIVCSLDDLSVELTKRMFDDFDEYGLRLVSFSIAVLDIPEDDPNRERLEAAVTRIGEINILGSNLATSVEMDVLTSLANNPGAGGMASAGMGMAMGMATGNIVGSMIENLHQKSDLFRNNGYGSEQPQTQQAYYDPYKTDNRFQQQQDMSSNMTGNMSGKNDPAEERRRRLRTLKADFDEGIITEEEYNAARQKIISEYAY